MKWATKIQRGIASGGTMSKGKPATGTLEWSTSSVNVSLGCSHDCLYCYAKAQAIRFKRATPESWRTEQINHAAVERRYGKRRGRIMLPTTHDITANTGWAVLNVARRLLDAGNDLLIVSKPSLRTIRPLLDGLWSRSQSNVLFRFTIGSYLDDTLNFWEPGAPCFGDRLASLALCKSEGWATSVSCEPMLENIDRMDELVHMLAPFVTDSIWLGKMNNARARLKMNDVSFAGELIERLDAIERNQADGQIELLYSWLKNHPLVRWKESIKKVVGLELATESGLDR
jgi:DNA repair photolyase